MSSLKRRLSDTLTDSGLAYRTVGHALVAHSPLGLTDLAHSLAATLVVDPECDVVVVDVPVETLIGSWESLERELPESGRGLRLVPGNHTVENLLLAGQWLAERLDRAVLAPTGPVLPAPNGTLFVDGGQNSGWVRFAAGWAPSWAGRRSPHPAWDSLAVASLLRTDSDAVAEPLPAGVWLRPGGDDRWVEAGRARLRRWLCCQPEILTVVLGGEGLPELELGAVAEWWAVLPRADRPKVRFVSFGPVRSANGATVGQSLADLLGEEVVCYCGLPVGPVPAPEVFGVRADGSHGWSMFAQQLAYRPRDLTAAEPVSPELRAHRRPLAGLPEVAPGVYRYTAEAVVEVVQAGLWIRPPLHDVPHAAAVRARAADPAVHLVLFEADGWAPAVDPKLIAAEVVDRLDRAIRSVSRTAPASGGTGPVSVAERLGSGAVKSDSTLRRIKAVLQPPMTALPRISQLWGRSAKAEDAAYGSESSAMDGVTEALWRRTGRAEEPVTADVAVRLYLASERNDLDSALRTAAAGSSNAFAGLVATGLSRLPVHRGGAVLTLAPTESSWEFYRRHPVVTERGFLHMVSAPCAGQEGDVDLIVWSMTGRRTGLLEEPSEGVGNRVVFLPGTTFRVLETSEPAPGRRGRILLRELSSAEVDGDTAEDSPPGSLDELTKTSLLRMADRWADRESRRWIPASAAARFLTLPGFA
jgi:hypothetical protein